MVREFVSSVREGRDPSPNLRESLILHAVIDGIYNSAEEGKEVTLTSLSG